MEKYFCLTSFSRLILVTVCVKANSHLLMSCLYQHPSRNIQASLNISTFRDKKHNSEGNVTKCLKFVVHLCCDLHKTEYLLPEQCL